MKIFLNIIFIYSFILGSSFAQDTDFINFINNDNFKNKISLKLNDKNNSGYSSSEINTKDFKKKDLIGKFSLSDKITSSESYLKKINEIPDKDLNKKYPIWIPITEVIGLNGGIAAFNAYVTKASFAKINFNTIATNLEIGAVWDHDHFITNFFAHPYHGNMYFNTARSNGYSFWESVPFSFGGSLMWELFMENEPPSTNDLISTTVSGYFLGEVLYRSSSLIIDERLTGFPRVTTEVFAGLLNPMRALYRI